MDADSSVTTGGGGDDLVSPPSPIASATASQVEAPGAREALVLAAMKEAEATVVAAVGSMSHSSHNASL